MTFTSTIKLKAAVLLLVFSLNSLRSLACAIHADRFIYSIVNKFDHYNIDHHDEKARSIHKYCEDDDDCKCPEKKSNKKRCCDEKVVAFDHLDKVPGHHISGNLTVPASELPVFLLSISSTNTANFCLPLTHSFRNPHSPPDDIRVSIQSFQI